MPTFSDKLYNLYDLVSYYLSKPNSFKKKKKKKKAQAGFIVLAGLSWSPNQTS